MSAGRQGWWWRLVKGFANFWWDFLVGDTPELFVASLVIVAVIAWTRIVWQENGLSIVLLPILCVLMLTLSLRRALRASKE